MKNDSDKQKCPKSNKQEKEEESEEEEFTIDERVKFRVCKKLAKVLFLNGGKKSIMKKNCENFAQLLEESVRGRSQKFPNYKKKILDII